MTAGEELWGQFYTGDRDRDLAWDTREWIHHLNNTERRKSDKMRWVFLRGKQDYNSRLRAVTMSLSQLPLRCTKVYLWLSVLKHQTVRQVKKQYNFVPG